MGFVSRRRRGRHGRPAGGWRARPSGNGSARLAASDLRGLAPAGSAPRTLDPREAESFLRRQMAASPSAARRNLLHRPDGTTLASARLGRAISGPGPGSPAPRTHRGKPSPFSGGRWRPRPGSRKSPSPTGTASTWRRRGRQAVSPGQAGWQGAWADGISVAAVERDGPAGLRPSRSRCASRTRTAARRWAC